jgi:hypothetical protein
MDERGNLRITSVVDTPRVLKRAAELTAANASVPINPHMSPSQISAAYERKAELAMEMGRLYKTDLAPNIGDWGHMPQRELAKCIGLDAGDVDARPNLRALEAGDYVDPANLLGTLNGTLVMLQTLPLYAYEYPELDAMFTDFSAEPGEFEQLSTTRVVNIPAVQKYDSTLDANGRPKGFVVASPAQTQDVDLTLTDYIGVPIVIGQATLSATPRQIFEEQAPAAIKAIAGYFTAMMTALLTPQNFNAYVNVNGTLVPVAYATYGKGLQDWSMTDMDKLSAIFTQNQVPRSQRGILLNPSYYQKLRGDPRLEFFFAASKGDPQLMESILPKGLSSFYPYESPYLPANLPFFAFHKAGIVLKARLPRDFTSALKLNSNQIPGSVTTITTPDSKLSVALIQRVDLIGNYSEWRPEVILGVGPGDTRGGLCGSPG